MQVTETASTGLRREYKVVVPANELDAKVNERLSEIKGRIRIDGFRPGKVPVDHLKRVYGRSVMAETIETVVREGNAKIIADNKFRLAMEPQVTLPSEQAEVEELISGKTDLAYTVAMEILAPIELTDFRAIELTKLDAEIADTEISDALKRIADAEPAVLRQGRRRQGREGRSRRRSPSSERSTATRSKAAPPRTSPCRSDPAPSFRASKINCSASPPAKRKLVKVAFPQNYLNAELAGKDAEFDVKVKSIEAPKEVTIDDEFAKSLGMESLDKLKDALRDRIKHEHDRVSRQRVKRALARRSR